MGILLGILFFAISFARADTCFDPYKEPKITDFLNAAKMGESQSTIDEIHRLIWEHRSELDPRLVYYRMMGESGGNPAAVHSSGGYGMFQFTGKPYNSRLTYRQILEAQYRENPQMSRRLIQVRYYLKEYLQRFSSSADLGWGCKRNRMFSNYTHLEKAAYLGWGSCDIRTLEKEKRLCRINESYMPVACSFATPLLLNTGVIPLCAVSAVPPRNTRIGGPSRGRE